MAKVVYSGYYLKAGERELPESSVNQLLDNFSAMSLYSIKDPGGDDFQPNATNSAKNMVGHELYMGVCTEVLDATKPLRNPNGVF